MEYQGEEPGQNPKFPRMHRLAVVIASGLHETIQQLVVADLNPHEGRLRASAAPEEYMPPVPDYIPDDLLSR